MRVPAGQLLGPGPSIERAHLRWDGAASGEAFFGAATALLHAPGGAASVDLNVTFGTSPAPVDSLAALGPRPVSGIWRLVIANSGSSAGTLNGWCVLTPSGGHCQSPARALTAGETTVVWQDLRTVPKTVETQFRISVDITHPNAAELTVRVEASAAVGDPVPGAELLLWDGAGWTPLDANDVAVSGTPDATWRLDADVDDPAALVHGPADNLVFGAAPLGHNGAQPAQLATDYAEVLLRYRTGP
jgi:hypothetical protein